MTALGRGGEFDLIRTVWARLGDRVEGAGDDCALITVDGVGLAISTDLAVEDRHFRRAWLSPGEIGFRSAAGSLSDLAAVAAEPLGVLVSVAAPAADADALIPELMAGVAEAAAAVGATVWGGDLVQSDRVLLDVVVVGRADRPVRRTGAASGDALWVTGRLGGPRAAVRAWVAGQEPGAAARSRFARPEPRVREARWLRDQGARAMIDISDGLGGDAGHLAAASGVACVLDAAAVPVHEGADGWEDAMAGGEEYELLVAMPAAFDARDSFQRLFAVPLTRIGACEAGRGVRVLRGGREVDIPASFSHY